MTDLKAGYGVYTVPKFWDGGRSPTTVQQVLVYMVETHLATLEQLESKKRVPKCELERQKQICKNGLWAVKAFCTVEDAVQMNCVRVAQTLESFE